MGRAAPVPGEQPPHPRHPTSPGQHHLGKGRACLPAGSNGRMAWCQGRRKAEEVTEAAGGFGGPDVGVAGESCGGGMWLPPHSSRRGEHSQPPQHVSLHCRHRNRQGVGTSPVESVGAGAASCRRRLCYSEASEALISLGSWRRQKGADTHGWTQGQGRRRRPRKQPALSAPGGGGCLGWPWLWTPTSATPAVLPAVLLLSHHRRVLEGRPVSQGDSDTGSRRPVGWGGSGVSVITPFPTL